MRVSKNELKYLRSLSQKKVRQAEKKFLVEGWRSLKELLNSPFEIDSVFILPAYLEDPDYSKIVQQVGERKIALKEIGEKDLRQIAETVQTQGVLAVVRQRATTLTEGLLNSARLVVALDAVADPGNVGTILRTSDWFGANLVLLGKGSVELYNDKVVRSTVGSLFRVPVVEGVDLATALADMRGRGFRICSLSADGRTDLADVDSAAKNVLVLGNEAQGVSKPVRSVADLLVRIPRAGSAESLNVAVACGIALHHFRSRS